jgi:hypothetical protein
MRPYGVFHLMSLNTGMTDYFEEEFFLAKNKLQNKIY